MIDLELSEPLDGLEHQVGAVLFDCDGTLVDTMGAHFRSWQVVLRGAGVERELGYPRFCEWGGMEGVAVAREICDCLGLSHDPQELAQRKRDHFLQQDEIHPPIEPVVAFARRAARRVPVAVVSGGNRPAVERALSGAGIRDLFSVVVTPEDVARGKPAPDMFYLAAERLGVAPGACLVLEDGPPGIAAARAAGMRVVAVGPVARQWKTERNVCPSPC